MTQYILILVQFVFIISIAPFASGLVKLLKARLQGRRGASPFLPYLAFATMLKKEMVIPKASSWIFKAAPFAVLASSLGLALVIPTIFRGGAMAPMSDFIIIAGIIMLGSVFLVLGGIDPGSAFGGMGSSREMTMAALLEPTLILVFSTFSFMTGSFTIDGMLEKPLLLSSPYLFLTIMALVMLALGENARYPVDNPATHLELTMIHEAMILEYSGPYLAMMEYASTIKLTVFSFLISNFIFPASLISVNAGYGAVILGLAFAVLKVLAVMAFLALLENTIVKMRFYRMNEYVSVSFFAAFFGLAAALSVKYLNLTVGYYTFFSILVIFFSVFLFGNIRIRPVLRYYIFSSLSIAGVAISLGFAERDELSHLVFFAAGTILIKAVLIPILMNYALARYRFMNELKTFLRPASSYMLATIILIISFFLINKTPIAGEVRWISVLYASIVLMIFGVAKMVINRNIFSQIVGLLVLENGLALFTLVTVKSVPLFIELGIFAVTLASVFILSRMSTNIKELYGSADTEELRNLID